MKPYEALELQAKAMRLVEGTELEWQSAIRVKSIHYKEWVYSSSWDFDGYIGDYELALAIVENRPVFKGDKLYSKLNGREYEVNTKVSDSQNFSWNPPKPRTVMVELLVEDAEYMCNRNHSPDRISTACRKALGELK